MIVMKVCINDSNYWVMLSTHELMDQNKVNVDVGNGYLKVYGLGPEERIS